jgi:hypothetical protein
MNDTKLPSPAGFAPEPWPKADPESRILLPRLLASLTLAVALFDLCFWKMAGAPGFSFAVFFCGLAGIILVNRTWSGGKRRLLVLIALLAGATVEAAVETCFTNTAVLFTLILALAGESFFVGIASPWGRWLSQVVALIFAPGRVFWLGARLIEAATQGGMRRTGGLLGGCLLALPALVLALIFGSLLATGNAVFGSWTNSFFTWFWNELFLYLDPERMIFWLFAAFLMLPLLRPALVSAGWWKWTENLPRFPEVLPPRSALFGSGMILVVLNLLFLVSNIADALFLWSGQPLPKDVSYKDYVHEGVEALIVTVVLSAIVLTAIFQQDLKVAERRELKGLAFLWIVQNVFLIISVTEKLRRYIVTYEMTVARLSTIIFLVLVCLGFVLLTIKIARNRSISWLIGGCVLATFATFYVTQFLDLAGWSANYNAARMAQDSGHRYGFDSATMSEWDSDVWPALRRANDLAPDDASISTCWQQALNGFDAKNRTQFDWQHWREFGLRAYWNRGALEEKPNN